MSENRFHFFRITLPAAKKAARRGADRLHLLSTEADRRALSAGSGYIFGISTLSTTWITPFDWLTSAIVTFATLPASS